MSYSAKYCGSLVDTINASLMHGTSLLPYYGASGPNRIISKRQETSSLHGDAFERLWPGNRPQHLPARPLCCCLRCLVRHNVAPWRWWPYGVCPSQWQGRVHAKGHQVRQMPGPWLRSFSARKAEPKSWPKYRCWWAFFLDVCWEWVFLKVEVGELYFALVENIFMDIFVHFWGPGCLNFHGI